MVIRRVFLRSFRNYDRLDLELPDGLTFFVGDNAQGKTNFLEAVYLCCMGRSHRTAKDKEMIQHGALAARARISVKCALGAHTVEAQIPSRGRKRLLLSDAPLRGVAELIGRTRCVFFSPEDLRMVKDGPAERRRFLDRELSQIRPAYLYALMQYTHALKQRNALLRAGDGGKLADWMTDFDKVMAEKAVRVLAGRRSFLSGFSGVVEGVHAELTGGRERLRVEYDGGDAKDTDEYLWHLRRTRDADLRRQTTTFGPHRDDIRLLVDDLDARAYGSQGQQRTVALALKLAEIRVMREETGEPPVLLLDDVLSELDDERQRLLLEKAKDVQTLVTSATLPPRPADSALFRVEGGRVTRG